MVNSFIIVITVKQFIAIGHYSCNEKINFDKLAHLIELNLLKHVTGAANSLQVF